MDTTELTKLISELADLDPADAPEAADKIAGALAAQLEAADSPGEESTD